MIPSWVESYLRIPFVSRGRDERGCDCFGIVRLVLLREKGIVTKDYGFVAANDSSAITRSIIEAEAERETWAPVPIADAKPFDVVPMTSFVVRQDGRGDVQENHVGVMVSLGVILHSEFASGPACVQVARPDVAVRLTPQAWRHRSLWA